MSTPPKPGISINKPSLPKPGGLPLKVGAVKKPGIVLKRPGGVPGGPTTANTVAAPVKVPPRPTVQAPAKPGGPGSSAPTVDSSARPVPSTGLTAVKKPTALGVTAIKKPGAPGRIKPMAPASAGATSIPGGAIKKPGGPGAPSIPGGAIKKPGRPGAPSIPGGAIKKPGGPGAPSIPGGATKKTIAAPAKKGIAAPTKKSIVAPAKKGMLAKKTTSVTSSPFAKKVTKATPSGDNDDVPVSKAGPSISKVGDPSPKVGGGKRAPIAMAVKEKPSTVTIILSVCSLVLDIAAAGAIAFLAWNITDTLKVYSLYTGL